jgi:hypothetical protein
MTAAGHKQLPWYAWPLIPVVLPVAVAVMLPLGLLALLSIPYFWLFPDRHARLNDFEGTPHQRARLARWRVAYRRLGLWGRVRRAIKLTRRRTWSRRTVRST